MNCATFAYTSADNDTVVKTARPRVRHAHRIRRMLLAVFLAIVVHSLIPPAHAAEPLTLAVVPQFEQRKLFAIWKPIIDEISNRTGIELKLAATLSIPEFERQLSKGRFDFVYTNPYHIVHELPRQGYIPLVRDKSPLRGILVVRKDDLINSVAELEGKTLAVPSLNAVGPLLVRVDLKQRHNVNMAVKDVKTHSSVYLHVINGLAAAGAGANKTLQEQDDAIRSHLRILYTTREMPAHPIAAHPRVPAAIRDKIQEAFLAFAATERGKALLGDIPINEAVATSIKDYQPMTQWGLDRYWTE